MTAVRENAGGFESKASCWAPLCVLDTRPVLDTSRFARGSVKSPEELGLVPDMAALFEELPFREFLLFSVGCCK